jgi:hypothetical protein
VPQFKGDTPTAVTATATKIIQVFFAKKCSAQGRRTTWKQKKTV